MELKDFVSESLKQIIDGVNEASKYAEKQGSYVNPDKQKLKDMSGRINSYDHSPVDSIEFDVAVTVIEGSQTKAGIGVFSGIVAAGSQGQLNATNSTVSRLKFTIPILLPTVPTPRKDNYPNTPSYKI